MAENEQALTFECEGETLVGVLHAAAPPSSRGVLIVVGGPQYRAGSHRQFTLLARHLAAQGVPVLRFDHRGMGDSTGDRRTFEELNADLRCAIDEFFTRVPGMRDVVVWGLCDAASAALMYAQADPRVSGLVVLNPWVHDERAGARVYLRHYYIQRLFQASLWRKIAEGEFSFRRAGGALLGLIGRAAGRGPATEGDAGEPRRSGAPFVARMEDGLRRFRGPVLLILSGNDFTAQEFKDLVAASGGWRRLLAQGRVARRDLEKANHTFSSREWRDHVARWTEQWVKSF